MNSCLLSLGALAGKHLVTLEGLNGDTMTPVQSALVEEGGIQCGFCTPGVVIALTGHLLNSDSFELRGVLESLDGNLCRCLIGAATTVEELLESSLLQRGIPHLHQFLAHVASTPVRGGRRGVHH